MQLSQIELDAVPGSVCSLKREDQKRMLQASLKFTESGEWEGIFSYPNCGWDLVQMGLAFTRD